MRVVLISTYDLGHQPFGLASPAAWLKSAEAHVTCADLAIEPVDAFRSAISTAELIAFYLPMHTATKLAVSIFGQVKQLNPNAHLCAYGLYAPVNETYLRKLGANTVLGGEFEQGLLALYQQLRRGKTLDLASTSLRRQQFLTPHRGGLPPLEKYARLHEGADKGRLVGYTEATRGCKHTCRHCPIVPVYNGRFRIVQRDIVLSDIRQQMAAGATHITFGDPDFFNGPGHSIPLVRALHQEFPDVTYDVTIKIEHLLKYARHLPILRDTNCLFITSAVEATDDNVLSMLKKGHTRDDFEEVVSLFRRLGLILSPTFVSFTPWTTARGYVEMLATIDNLGLIEHVAPIQYAIRLLIPAGSKLLDLPDVISMIEPYDEAKLAYGWSHPDPRMDALYETAFRLVKAGQRSGESRRTQFERVWREATSLLGGEPLPERKDAREAVAVPVLSEDWY